MELEGLVEKIRLHQLERRFECELVLIPPPPPTTKAEAVHEGREVLRPKISGMGVKIFLKYIERPLTRGESVATNEGGGFETDSPRPPAEIY